MGDILINGDVLIAVCVLAGLVLLGGLVAAGMLAMKLVRRRRQSPTPSSLSLATVTATGGSYSKLETVKVGGSDGDDKVANDVIQKVGKDSSKISFVNPSLPTQLPLGSINSASAGSPNYGTANATRKQIPNTSIPPPPASPRKITGLSDDEEETLLSPINNHINSSINNHSSVAAAAAPAWSAEAPPFTVLLAHTPVKRDDLALAVGDQVRVSMCFSDGFVHGVNMTTGKVGVFPLSCVKSPARRNSLSSSSLARTSHEQQHQQKLHSAPANMMDDDIVYNGTGGDLDHHHSGKLILSMIPPDQAMELVSDDLRAKYFEETFRRNSVSQHRLSIDSNMSGGGGGNSSTGGSITDIHNNNNTTTSRDSSNTNSNRSSITSVRGKRNWAKLKLGWRDVVRSQFESSYLEWSNKSDRFDIWAFIADNYRKEEEAVMPGVQHQQQESSSSPASSTSSLPPPLIPTTVSTIGQPNITSSPPIVLINPALNRVSAASSINEEDLRSSVSSSSSSFSFITPPHGTIHVEELEEDENGELGVTSGGSSSPDDRFHTPAIL